MTSRNSLPIHLCLLFVLLSPCASRVAAGDPVEAWLAGLRKSDASRIPAYTLTVTLEEPANFIFRDQGNSIKTCTITEGPLGLAASCEADQLPTPVYRVPGAFNTEQMDYDDEGNLAIVMRVRWVTLRTHDTNETYEENRALYVNPKGVVVRSGTSRRLDRCPPDDKGRCSWTFTTLRRIWWALGHGFASDLIEVEGDVADSGKMIRARVRGSVFGSGRGAWQMTVEKSPTRLVREAAFFREIDGLPLHNVTTHGARRFGNITLAAGGSFRSLFGDGFEALERRVVLQDFQPRFDDQLFAEVKRTLASLDGQNVKVVDYRSDPQNPLRTSLGVRTPHNRNDK